MQELTDAQKMRLQRFMGDPVTPGAIHQVLMTTYLKKRADEDTNMKAARFLALELLEEGWKELEKYQVEIENNGSTTRQIGL